MSLHAKMNLSDFSDFLWRNAGVKENKVPLQTAIQKCNGTSAEFSAFAADKWDMKKDHAQALRKMLLRLSDPPRVRAV